MNHKFKHPSGFSLVELLVALAITGIVGAVILKLYLSNTQAYSAQLQVAEAQQNVRAGMDSLLCDLRMAGYDPTGTATASFLRAESDRVQITMDLSGDGDTNDANENVTFRLYTSHGIRRLGRDTNGDAPGGNAPAAEYIDAIGFAYAFDSDADGALDTDGGGRIHWALSGANGNWWELDGNNDDQLTLADDTDGDGALNLLDTGIAADLDDIRAVKIWLLGRVPQADRDFSADRAFQVGGKIVTPNDRYRRRLLTTTVLCRNMRGD